MTFQQVFANVQLQAPMMMAQPPGDGSRWFVALRDGRIVSFSTTSPGSAPTQVAALPNVQQGGEGGLLGFAFHPRFAQNGLVYVTWVRNAGPTGFHSEVGSLRTTNNGASFGDYQTILEFDQPASNHNGGGIAFGKDGLLYLSFGDGGGGDDTFVNGQKKTGFFSKILRIDVDHPAGSLKYGIPEDNPFKSGGGEPATYAWGFRNPFRFSIDGQSGEVWVADVGQNKWEEIDRVALGGNYGWPCKEGTHDYISSSQKCPSKDGLRDPVAELEHLPGPNSRSITGGVVYHGKAIPALSGTYVFGDYEKQQLWGLSFDPTSGAAKLTQLNESGPSASWVAFAEDQDGEVYALALNQGDVYKLVPTTDGGASTFPAQLSMTGCVDPADPTKPAPGLVPYGVNAALWSDGAEKERFMALPEGQRIAIAPNGHLDFPNGTVLVKNFSVGGRRVETRLFVRHDDGGWAGYSYEWNDAQTDATLLLAGKAKAVGAQTWSYPSRSDCVRCHTEAAGRSLGLELGQQNGDFVYASTNRVANQLATLEHIGMFAGPLPKPIDQLPAYPDPTRSAGTVESRARAYLHANCSFCHQPRGGGRGDLDLRFSTSLADTRACDGDAQAGSLGVAGAKLLAPGAPDRSLISLRARASGADRMPPLGTSVVDTAGVQAIDAYIASLMGCP